MGNSFVKNTLTDGEFDPLTNEEPSFDSDLGFANGRKQRVMVATEDELIASMIPLDTRDYCAHTFIAFKGCISKNFPWYTECRHEQHAYGQCEYEDYVLRMKEYERERRLRARAKRIALQQA